MADTYRKDKIPLDAIVQDYYWPSSQQGSQTMDPSRYPDPKGMLDTGSSAQDVGMIATSHRADEPGLDTFSDFTLSG